MDEKKVKNVHTSEKPIRTPMERPGAADTEETHPAYALIAASRVSRSGSGKALFGSDFLHGHYMTIKISPAGVGRGLSYDWYHTTSRLPYIEVALSESQWATLLSTPNMGEGTPCTLTWTAEEGYIPAIEPDQNRRQQFNAEVDEHLQDALRAIDEVLDRGKVSKADRDKLEHARRQLGGNLTFVAKSFDEHAEKTVDRAKAEFAGWQAMALQRAGLGALAGESVLSLPDEAVTEEVGS